MGIPRYLLAPQTKHVSIVASCGQHLGPMSRPRATQGVVSGMEASDVCTSCWHVCVSAVHKHVGVAACKTCAHVGAFMWHNQWHNDTGACGN